MNAPSVTIRTIRGLFCLLGTLLLITSLAGCARHSLVNTSVEPEHVVLEPDGTTWTRPALLVIHWPDSVYPDPTLVSTYIGQDAEGGTAMYTVAPIKPNDHTEE